MSPAKIDKVETSEVIDKLVRKQDFSSNLAMLGITTAISGLLMREVGKMFGDDKISIQQIVRDMMDGAISGILFHFENKIDDLKRERERLSEKIEELELDNEGKAEQINALQQELIAAKEKLKKHTEAKKPKPRGRKPKTNKPE